jgi:hypothetical protein
VNHYRRSARHQVLLHRLIQGTVIAAAALSALVFAAAPTQAATLNTVTAPKGCSALTVSSGDYLSSIAQRVGSTTQALAETNHLANPDSIQAGQHLVVCGRVISSVVKPQTNAAPGLVTPQMASVAGTDWAGEPCRSGVYSTGAVYMWKVPPGCYGGVYWVNARNYVSRAGFGWCNWWPEVLHPGVANILLGTRHSRPIPGAAVVFAPGEQGASYGGHYGEVVAVLGNGWILISEMNNSWRGAGFGRVNYRYVREDSGVTYIY